MITTVNRTVWESFVRGLNDEELALARQLVLAEVRRRREDRAEGSP